MVKPDVSAGVGNASPTVGYMLETHRIFESATKSITNNITTMGIEELILHRAEQQGIEKGIEKGKSEIVRNLITKMGLTNEQAADIAGVDLDFVKKIRKEMNGEK